MKLGKDVLQVLQHLLLAVEVGMGPYPGCYGPILDCLMVAPIISNYIYLTIAPFVSISLGVKIGWWSWC